MCSQHTLPLRVSALDGVFQGQAPLLLGVGDVSLEGAAVDPGRRGDPADQPAQRSGAVRV